MSREKYRILRSGANGGSVLLRIAGHGTRGHVVRRVKIKDPKGNKMTTFQIATLVALGIQSAIALGVGSVQCILIWKGLRQMERASEFRERESARRHEEVMRESARRHEETIKNHEENMKKHEESMTALKTLIERTGK